MANDLNAKNELKANPIEANPTIELSPTPVKPSAEPSAEPSPAYVESPGLDSAGSGPSPEPSGLESSPELSPDPSSGRRRNAKGHKPECTCTLCARIQARIARGEPSQAEVREQRRQQREQKQREQQKQRTTLLSRKRQEREAQRTALEASIETQARLGHKPNVTLAGEIVGMDPRRAQQVSQAEGFVQGALSRAGITDDKLAQIAAEGLDAALQRIITDRDGRIIDVVNVPDWKSRHAFWADLLRVKKILGGENNDGGMGSGGLIIITPDSAKVLPGHPPACVCDACKLAWEEKTQHLRRAANREAAILTSALTSAVNSQQPPIDAEETEVEEVEYDDFGPVE